MEKRLTTNAFHALRDVLLPRVEEREMDASSQRIRERSA